MKTLCAINFKSVFIFSSHFRVAAFLAEKDDSALGFYVIVHIIHWDVFEPKYVHISKILLKSEEASGEKLRTGFTQLSFALEFNSFYDARIHFLAEK